MLICTAAGEPGKTGVLVGGRLARRLNAQVTLLYVAAEAMPCSRRERAHLEHAASALRALDVPVSIRIRPARSPAKGILFESREGDHDLIVMGHHGPKSRALFASDDVTLQVLVGADRPVMIVPADAVG
ncbi:MAG: universal stress protein [Planctomycetota bacterium]